MYQTYNQARKAPTLMRMRLNRLQTLPSLLVGWVRRLQHQGRLQKYRGYVKSGSAPPQESSIVESRPDVPNEDRNAVLLECTPIQRIVEIIYQNLLVARWR
jgi:hypothetical protein